MERTLLGNSIQLFWTFGRKILTRVRCWLLLALPSVNLVIENRGLGSFDFKTFKNKKEIVRRFKILNSSHFPKKFPRDDVTINWLLKFYNFLHLVRVPHVLFMHHPQPFFFLTSTFHTRCLFANGRNLFLPPFVHHTPLPFNANELYSEAAARGSKWNHLEALKKELLRKCEVFRFASTRMGKLGNVL